MEICSIGSTASPTMEALPNESMNPSSQAATWTHAARQHPSSHAATHGPTLGAPPPPSVGGGVLVLVVVGVVSSSCWFGVCAGSSFFFPSVLVVVGLVSSWWWFGVFAGSSCAFPSWWWGLLPSLRRQT